MKRLLCLCLPILLCALKVSAIDAVVSHNIFYIPGTQNDQLVPSVEVYWQANPNTLHYKTTEEKTFIGRIKADIVLSNKDGIASEEHYIIQTRAFKDIGEVLYYNIIDLKKFALHPGFIKLKVRLTDVEDTFNHFTFTDTFTVFAAPDAAFFSGIQLLDTIIASPAKTLFEKNGRQQVPSCNNFLDEKTTTLHYYTELYGTSHIAAKNYPLTEKIYIAKKENDIFYKHYINTDSINSPQKTLAIAGSFPIATLESGNFYVQAILEDKDHEPIASQSFFFQRLNPHPTIPPPDTTTVQRKTKTATVDTGMEDVTVINLNKTFLAKYDLAEVRSILKMLLPFSDEQGVRSINTFLKKPDETYMRYYIYNYFASINKKDPGKAWKEFYPTIIDVNKKYSEHGTPGYATDRGIIYLKYGTPTDVITVENEPGSLPYEIWQYNLLTQKNNKEISNAVFLFYRPNNISSEYRILHSTVGGEVQNTSWRQSLYINEQGGSNFNSRAEQYIGNK